MNILLTEEMKEYIDIQMNKGLYTSIDEVVCAALKTQAKLALEKELDESIAASEKEFEEGNYFVADDAFFDEIKDHIMNKYVN